MSTLSLSFPTCGLLSFICYPLISYTISISISYFSHLSLLPIMNTSLHKNALLAALRSSVWEYLWDFSAVLLTMKHFQFVLSISLCTLPLGMVRFLWHPAFRRQLLLPLAGLFAGFSFIFPFNRTHTKDLCQHYIFVTWCSKVL